MTLNSSWGHVKWDTGWKSIEQVIFILREITAGGGCLLLNVGPPPSGSIPAEARSILTKFGTWLATNGEAVYAKVDKVGSRLCWMNTGCWTLKGNTAYFWRYSWDRELTIGGLQTRAKRITLLSNNMPISFEQTAAQLILRDLPSANPEAVADMAVFRIEFDSPPSQKL